jgi:hypothetical protein
MNEDMNAAVHSPQMKAPLEKLGMIGLGNKSPSAVRRLCEV